MMDLVAVSPAAERARRCQEYLEALEEERRKIEVFQRELPLSLHLVTQAIESYRQQMAVEMLVVGCGAVNPSEREEEALEISSEGAPVLEEFIPIKRSSSSEADDEEEPGDRRQHHHQHSGNGGHNDEDRRSSTSRQKPKETTSENVPDWLRSVQLWSQQPDSHPLPREEKHTLQDMNARRPSAVEPKKSTGAFHPFHPQKRSPPPPPPPPVEAAPVPAPAPSAPVTSSNSENRGVGVGSDGGGGGKSGCSGGMEKDGNPNRKSRRCWSPELHRRFLNALQHLGGSDVATPKRIRELMKVDSLTNDEVKSHLQKYRLHSRRPSPTSHANSGSAPPQQVVFVGGIWVPPPEYAAAAAAVAAAATEGNPHCPPAAEIYAPVASIPAPKQQQQHKQGKQQQQQRSSRGRDEQCVADDGAIPSDSPATSSSSRTNTSGLAGRRR